MCSDQDCCDNFNGAGEQHGLFSDCRLSIKRPPSLRERISEYFSRLRAESRRPLHVVVVPDKQRDVCCRDCQLTLPFEFPPPSTPVHIVPALRRAFLDYEIYDIFHDIPDVARAALRLEKKGVRMLGQLVQMSPEDVRRHSFIGDQAFAAMEARLAEIDLRFGMRHPAWNRQMRKAFAMNL